MQLNHHTAMQMVNMSGHSLDKCPVTGEQIALSPAHRHIDVVAYLLPSINPNSVVVFNNRTFQSDYRMSALCRLKAEFIRRLQGHQLPEFEVAEVCVDLFF